MPKQKQPDFSPEEMEQIQRHGQALGGPPTNFDEEVEKHLADHYPEEFSAAKMHAAQTGAPEAAAQDLGPSDIDTAQVKQRGALQSQAATQAAQQAQQAQAAQAPVNAPPAPSGPAGNTTPFPAQKGAVGGGGNAQQPSQGAPPPQPPGPQEASEEGADEDPATQFPP